MSLVDISKIFLIRNSLKAVACIIVAYDIIRSNVSVEKRTENYLKHWMTFIMEESGYFKNEVSEVYEKIAKFYSDYTKLKCINFNLDRTQNLNFE
jgi:hypothetical protein